MAALATAVLSVLALNYFFIEPRHRLTISDSENVVALGVLLIAAVVVGRLAATARERAQEAEPRARLAAAREAGGDGPRRGGLRAARLGTTSRPSSTTSVPASPRRPTGAAAASQLGAPPQGRGELCRSRSARPGWIVARTESGWAREDLERIGEPLGRLIDVALEHERISSQFAETEATRRADAAKTALLHAISHDLRSPLTAITTAAGGLRAATGSRATSAASCSR